MDPVARRRPHPARVALYAHGYSMAAFARFHGRSEHWVRRVFAGKEPVPDHFRKDLSVFLEMDKRELFPELAERQPA